ncbi:MAG: phosphatidylglycerophosphatase A [Planctomycetes bacterium]|nr:phosphatidylglycerophosphatase A [Planctomycetota bacterium]
MSRSAADGLRAMVLTVLGSGYAPFASGSWGSLASVVLFFIAWRLSGVLGWPPLVFDLGVVLPGIVVATVLGVRWGDWAIRRWKSDDPKPFVLDEFAGQWIALLFLPPIAAASPAGAAWVLGGQFFLFRVFDVLKPPPAGTIDQHWPGGWGITFDDLFAGLYAALVGQALWRLTPLAISLGLA